MIRAVLNRFRRRKAQAAYREAFEAHWSACRRGDTRSIHDTRQALLAANCERLRVGA